MIDRIRPRNSVGLKRWHSIIAIAAFMLLLIGAPPSFAQHADDPNPRYAHRKIITHPHITEDGELRITAVNGNTVTVSPALSFNHKLIRTAAAKALLLPCSLPFSI